MAAFLSNQSLLVWRPCSTSFSSKPLLQIQTLPSHPHLTTPILPLGFQTNSSSLYRRTTLFKSYLASQDSFPTINKESEVAQNDASVTDDDVDKNSLPSIMALIEAYKKAILNRDEGVMSWIEVRLQSIANKKTQLIQKVSTLSAEKVASKEKRLRLQADFENFRKKSDKERLSIQSDAQEEVIEKLLLMVDNFEKAKQQIKAATTDKEKKIDSSYQGIYKQFVEIMRSHNVSVIATVGKPFNPLLHEAISREESHEFKEGIIIKETRRGFLLRDRVLRPALVKVSLGPGDKKSTESPDKSEEQSSAAAGVDER